MAKGLGTLTVWLTADTKKFRSGLQGARAQLLSWKTAMVGGIGVAAGAVGAFGVSSVRAFMAAEQATIALKAALNEAGGATAHTLPTLAKYASAIQRQTVLDDDAVKGAMAYGLNLGIATDKIDEAAKAAAGLAARFKIDLNTAMMLIGRASQGQTQMLTRYGIALDATATQEEKFNQLLRIGADSFGLAKAETESTSGKLAQMRNAWGDLKETIGELIVELLDLSGVFGQGTSSLQAFGEELQNNLQGISFFIKSTVIDVQAGFQQIWAVLSASIGNIGSIFSWIRENFDNLMANIGNILGALLLDFRDAVTNAVSGYLDIVKAFWQGVWSVIKGGDISDALNGVMDAVAEGAARTIGGLGKNLDKALAEAGITDLKLIGFGDLGDELDRIRLDAEKRKEALFQASLSKVGAIDQAVAGNKQEREQEQKRAGVKVESPIVAAIHRGSVEALRAENMRLSKDAQIANNTKRTADGVSKLVNVMIKKFTPTSDPQPEDVFA